MSLADKLHNARSIMRDYRRHGEALWARFKTGEGASVRWYYKALADAFDERRPALGSDAEWALDEFRGTVAAIERLAGDRP